MATSFNPTDIWNRLVGLTPQNPVANKGLMQTLIDLTPRSQAGEKKDQAGAALVQQIQSTLNPTSTSFDFALPSATAGLGVPQAPTARQLVESLIPGIQVTSENRTEADQERLRKSGYNPAKNSAHLYAGQAVDFIPPKGTDPKVLVAQLNANGLWAYHDPKRGHIHADLRPQGTRTVMPTVQPGQTTFAGGVQTVDPMTLMGMVPNPRMLPQVNLPNAPQRELPDQNVPLMEAMDKAGLLAPLAEAMKVKERDKKFDKWDRIQAMLGNAAAAASNVSPWAGTGQFLLAAGAGGAQGFRGERKEQRQLDMAEDEAKRQVQVALAKMGFDIDVKNIGIKEENAVRKYNAGEKVKDVKFANASASDQRSVEEILRNSGITAQNIGELNSTDRVRANVGIGAIQQNSSAVNAANSQQLQLNVANAKSDENIDKEMQSYGLDPKATKDPLTVNARQTLMAVKANSTPLALSGLGQEILLSGHFKEVLGDADAKAVDRLIQQKNEAGAAQIVTNALTANMQSKPDEVKKLVDELAALGLPSAIIISKRMKRAPSTAQ